MKIRNVFAAVAVFAALALVGATAQASEKDKHIEKTARELYVFKTYLKDDAIKIESKNGVVTLTGTVAEEPHRALAGETVASLRGVKSVDNKLEIKGERAAENSDAWVVARVKTMLLFHRSVSGVKTEVSAKEGVVTLRGEALNQAQKELTTEYAKDVDGVKDVRNEMTVAPAAKTEKATVGEKIDDASITAQVKLSLLLHRSTRVLKTHVDTVNGAVTLKGTAKNAAEKDLVTKLVEDVNGVAKVHNRMTVAEPKGK
jgi:osmotically-inducible protein OsmY